MIVSATRLIIMRHHCDSLTSNAIISENTTLLTGNERKTKPTNTHNRPTKQELLWPAVEIFSLCKKALRCVRAKDVIMRILKAAGFSYRAATTLIPFCATRASPPTSYLLDASVDELRLHNSDDPVFHPPLPSFLPFFRL